MTKQDKVFKLLTIIPKGKVTTYKILAQKTGIKNPRTVGQILHSNENSDAIPCYKVVRSDGKIASGYGAGGPIEQIRRLRKDGIEVYNRKVNLQEYCIY